MRFIPTKLHGAMDYLVGILLIAAPWIFDFAADGAETWVPVVLGMGVILYSLMTAYECGVVGWISMSAHLGMDVMGGILLAASPWLFGFSDHVWIPHLAVGLFEIGAGLCTRTLPSKAPGPSGMRHHPGAGI